ncbi:MAG TPA: hypothetical protein VD846_03105 [Allosphingosinicella sp.]|nr:hypothetical protein [Allosphingosinicella sp.]
MSPKRNWRSAGCAALLGAAIAFPTGVMVGGGGGAPREKAREPSRPPPSRTAPRTTRNVYSPRVATDPYVIDQQRRVLEVLEASCRQSKRHCAEAEQARRRIEEAESAR